MINPDPSGIWYCDVYGTVTGPTPQVAICRAVVRAAFGDEVEEVAVCA